MTKKGCLLEIMILLLSTACATPHTETDILNIETFQKYWAPSDILTDNHQENTAAEENLSDKRRNASSPYTAEHRSIFVESVDGEVRVILRKTAPAESTRSNLLLRLMLNAYQAFRYDDVLSQCRQVLSEEGSSPVQRAEAKILAGAAWYLKGFETIASDCFREAHRLCPHASLNEALFPRALVNLICTPTVNSQEDQK